VKKYLKGFTLIELMVVVSIVGILASIAVPAYADYVRRGKISEATMTLQDLRVRMEQYFLDNRTYASSGTTCGPTVTSGKYFTITCTGSASTYSISAAGPGPSDSSMNGFTYTIDQSNNRRTTALPSGWTGASASSTCWVVKKDGSC
jgi:type IV pilus assembly protein PilE